MERPLAGSSLSGTSAVSEEAGIGRAWAAQQMVRGDFQSRSPGETKLLSCAGRKPKHRQRMRRGLQVKLHTKESLRIQALPTFHGATVERHMLAFGKSLSYEVLARRTLN